MLWTTNEIGTAGLGSRTTDQMMHTRTSGLKILCWRRKAWEPERRRLNMNHEAKCVNRRRVDLRTLIQMRT